MVEVRGTVVRSREHGLILQFLGVNGQTFRKTAATLLDYGV